MFYLSKRIDVAFAHRLELDYESKCSRMHGHNAIVTVYCKTERLNNSGMVVDFKEISSKVKALLDHQCANDVVDFNPTAEQLAEWICRQIPNCYKVSFQESEGNTALYVKDGHENEPL